jgi:hypothetical protein
MAIPQSHIALAISILGNNSYEIVTMGKRAKPGLVADALAEALAPLNSHPLSHRDGGNTPRLRAHNAHSRTFTCISRNNHDNPF